LLDTISAAVSGADLLPGRKALAFASAERGLPEASVMGADFRATTAMACFANAMMAHADETDDSHSDSRSHPGCCVVPAALSVAERRPETTGDALLRAITLGYDVGTRVVRSLGTQELFHAGHATHAFAGVFGAAAAAGSILRFTPEQFRWLLSYAAQQAAGILAWRRDPEHVQKSFVFAGMPARNGVLAALMIEAGFTGVDDVFSGAHNLFLVFGKKPDPVILAEDLGEHFALMKTTIKKWSVGSPGQPLLDMGRDLVINHKVRPEVIARLTMRISARESVAAEVKQMPNINVRHLMSLMLVDRTVTFASAHDIGRMSDPVLLALQKKIHLIVDPEIGFRRPVIELETTDGKVMSLQASAVRGSPANPMSEDEVIEKSIGLAAPRLGEAAAHRLVDAILQLGGEPDVAERAMSCVRREGQPCEPKKASD
jgi:2-methylcitrate dehydratase PrpD